MKLTATISAMAIALSVSTHALVIPSDSGSGGDSEDRQFAECPDSINFFQKEPGSGRINKANELVVKIGGGRAGTLDECARRCEFLPACGMFEFRDGEVGRCAIFQAVPNHDFEILLRKNWEVFTRVAQRCDDNTCSCSEFHIPTTTTTEATTTPEETPAPRVIECAAALADQFVETPNTIIKKRANNVIRQFFAEDLRECQRACVHYGDGQTDIVEARARRSRDFSPDGDGPDFRGDLPTCLAVEYSAAARKCALLSVKGTETGAGDHEVPTKPSGRSNLWNRNLVCDEDVPAGVCISSSAVSYDFETVHMRYRGPKVKGRASSAADCAARCLATPVFGCKGFAFIARNSGNGGSCHLVVEEIDTDLYVDRVGTFFARSNTVACNDYTNLN
eukprot:m.151670 g.151670  ORF g.151670 m.151670 type:complete len:392 (+) comp23358_c0_seq1:121-1296(+)